MRIFRLFYFYYYNIVITIKKYFIVSKLYKKLLYNVTLRQKCLLNMYEVKQSHIFTAHYMNNEREYLYVDDF